MTDLALRLCCVAGAVGLWQFDHGILAFFAICVVLFH